MRQQSLVYRTWGGARKGAGRKPAGKRPGEKHARRPRVDPRAPLHITLRVERVLPNLRAEVCIAALRAAFHDGRQRFGFRLVQYAVQPNHVHLIVEAGGPAPRVTLMRGVKGLCVRIARRLNTALGRRGRVFADCYHARPLGTPREVRRALAYVLLQQRRHAAQRGVGMTTALDPCSSAGAFDGWTRGAPRDGPWSETTVAPGTWLLSVGWRRHGRIDPAEVPATAHAT